jgi:catechol 2,3-dioxygenase-like lactoylglutathione lyase family enzyme
MKDYLQLEKNVVLLSERLNNLFSECIFLLDMSIDHIAIITFDFQKTVSFYEAILSTLGYKKLMIIQGDEAVGFGNQHPSFWIHHASTSNEASPRIGTHIAFVANSRQKVDEFYRTALKHGAKDNGSPGLRPQYHRCYYGAFVIDADGNNIEAVNHFDWRSFMGWKMMISIFTISLIFISIFIKKFF